ncbi:phage tail assembly protein [Formicincola oecophyllae]|uniref:Phage tail assembly protein n=1 Tax=Formicincola oecophyllae TaxID=2558361 RepID=A0A4Y6UC53_9PROT|nr:phage tail assembly protein [Formicincola oecophyllae]QDH14056.1 phage tail assembly protein [Formicincola oecophyllae]
MSLDHPPHDHTPGNAMPPWLEVNPDHSITVRLSRPYILPDTTERSTVTLREPTVADQKAFMPSGPGANARQTAEAEARFLAALADGITPSFMDGLALRDYQRLQVAFGFFLD